MGRERRRDDRVRDYSARDTSGSNPRASAITDPLTSVDDLLRETNQQLEALTTAISQQPPIQPSNQPPAAGGGSGLVPRDQPAIYPYDFSRVVPADTLSADPVTETFVAPHDGTARRVVLGFSLGTQQAVGIGLTGPDQEALIPRGPRDAQFIAYDDKVLSFALNKDLEDDDEITISFVNNDSQDHFVNVDIFFQKQVSNDAD